jgi:hypothetical protein
MKQRDIVTLLQNSIDDNITPTFKTLEEAIKEIKRLRNLNQHLKNKIVKNELNDKDLDFLDDHGIPKWL